MISRVAIGAVEAPESAPGDPVIVVAPLSNSMSSPTSYIVELLLPAEIPSTDVVVTGQTATEVELTITRPDGYAGSGLTIYVLATEDLNFFVDGPGDISGLLDAGWTGNTSLYKGGAVVYLQVELTATASIDGITKDTTIPLLNGLDLEFQTGIYGVGPSPVFIGYFYDENKNLIGAKPGGTSFDVEGMAGVTDPWVDGVSKLWGQITWLAMDPQPA